MAEEQIKIKRERLVLPQIVKDNKENILTIISNDFKAEFFELQALILPARGKNKILDYISKTDLVLLDSILINVYTDEAIKYLYINNKEFLITKVLPLLPKKPAKCKQCKAEGKVNEYEDGITISCPTDGCLINEYVKELPLAEWNDYMEVK